MKKHEIHITINNHIAGMPIEEEEAQPAENPNSICRSLDNIPNSSQNNKWR
jgi:hypothetical protein